jgi:hypothetical protein
MVYTLRINGTSYRPKVFERGRYTLRVGEGDAIRVFVGVEAVEPGETATIEVAFE